MLVNGVSVGSFQVLQLANLRADEMDMVEINEAFSVVALANIMVIIFKFLRPAGDLLCYFNRSSY